MDKSWRNLEQYVRHLGQILWHKPLLPERIDGVNFDGVARLSDEEIVLVEITEEHNLEKVRADTAKIAAVKMQFAAQSIVARAFIVLKEEPTPGMLDIGKANKIHVLSVRSFAQQAFDFNAYESLRSASPFGSAIDPATGQSDSNTYIPVTYLVNDSGKTFGVRDICDNLSRRNRLVLLGEYGTGKSRCVREVFQIISKEFKSASAYPLAINLREHWGALSGVEIIAGHFQRLGLSGSVDRAMQLLKAGSILLLLDGFDEVGTQTFGNSEDRRASIRKQALSGVRDLLEISTGGVLVTGRPHYFEDNKELLEAIGLSFRTDGTSVLKCRDEFEEPEANAYLTALGLKARAPKWLPKKPLMFQILASMDRSDAEEILQSQSGEVGFWGQFIDTVCTREAKMHTSIEAATVRSVLGLLARFTRTSSQNLGRLTPKDINRAYELATGYAPDQAGQLMLSRLCTLGRIEPESPDRQFVDPYIVQLLFADCVVDDISSKNHEVLGEAYSQALQPLGLYFLAQWIELYDFESDALSFVHRDGAAQNSQVLGEIVAALLLLDGEPLDFSGTKIVGAEICILALGFRKIYNVEFSDGIIDLLSLENCVVEDKSNVSVKRTEILRASGLSSAASLPEWVEGCKLYAADSVSNAARIKASPLPPAQKLFLSIVHKVFFQRGGGRKENSLYKGGFGQNFDKKLIDKILTMLVSQGLVEKSKDSSGSIYNPRREYTARMKAIRDQLSLSKDPLWLQLESLT
ncbi:hypothetical protein [Polaromonas sp. YR568]|uniref:hypothetical protein n=1 Tax=Polaromonas sp. YR568 TaxID=1855301 RepID=UPI003137B1D3